VIESESPGNRMNWRNRMVVGRVEGHIFVEKDGKVLDREEEYNYSNALLDRPRSPARRRPVWAGRQSDRLEISRDHGLVCQWEEVLRGV